MNSLGLFAKQPVAGQVKTRLARQLGAESAARLAEAFFLDVTARFAQVGNQRHMGYAPATATAWFAQTAPTYQLWAQPTGDLGERMQAFFHHTAASGAQRSILIGCDSPWLTIATLQSAWHALLEHDVVLLPTADGGYALIGQRAPARLNLAGLTWSHSQVCTQTQQRAAEQSLSVALLPPTYDIDEWDDLQRLARELALASTSQNLSDSFAIPARTWNLLKELGLCPS